jgi:hypothetical protein
MLRDGVVHTVRLGVALIANEDHLAAQSSSFFRCDIVFRTYTMHSNVLRWCIAYFLPCHASNRVMPFIGHLFSTYTTAFTASPQKHPGKPLAFSMLLAVANTVPF